jgi:hypothetical protein
MYVCMYRGFFKWGIPETIGLNTKPVFFLDVYWGVPPFFSKAPDGCESKLKTQETTDLSLLLVLTVTLW